VTRRISRQCCQFQEQQQTSLLPSVGCAFLGCQGKKAVDELSLSKKIISCHPSNLPLPDHLDRFVALNRLPERPGILGSPAWHSHDLQQSLNVAQRKRLAQIPPNRSKDDAGFSLPPLEDRGSRCHFAIHSGHKTASIFSRYNIVAEDQKPDALRARTLLGLQCVNVNLTYNAQTGNWRILAKLGTWPETSCWLRFDLYK
jgi:hypothetical protein